MSETIDDSIGTRERAAQRRRSRTYGSPGVGTVDSPDAFVDKYEDVVGAVLDCPTIVGFCYTQLTDTEQETNGLLTQDRRPKLDPSAVRAITHRPSKSVPGDVIANLQQTSEVTSFQTGGG